MKIKDLKKVFKAYPDTTNVNFSIDFDEYHPARRVFITSSDEIYDYNYDSHCKELIIITTGVDNENMEKNNMNKDEKSLLLFLETIVVDQRGWINSVECLNLEEIKIMKQWNESGFVISKKASRQYREKTQLTYIIKLSNEAWKEVHKLRRERAERNIPEELKGKNKKEKL